MKTKTVWYVHNKRPGKALELKLVEQTPNPNGRVKLVGDDRVDERDLGGIVLDAKEALSLARILIDFAESAGRVS